MFILNAEKMGHVKGKKSLKKTKVADCIVQIIFHFLWDHWVHYGTFEDGVLLMYTLEGVSSVANFITAYEESQ